MLWHALLDNLPYLIEWPSPLILLLGTLGGMIFGCIPGLNGPILIALLIPLTIPLGPMGAMVLVGAVMGAVTTGGSIPAILLNAPGTETNAATSIDGFELAKQGKASLALGTAALSSAIGGLFGLLLLVIILPFGYSVILAFSYPENFMLAIMGIVLIAVISQGEVLKGIIAGGFGLMLTFIGADPFTGETRYVFGINYLWGGISFVPALIGLFAVTEVYYLMKKGGTITEKNEIFATDNLFSGFLLGFKTIISNFWLFLRSTIIGFFVGAIPGVGGTVASFVAYMQAVQTSKNKKMFGKGDIRGVLAPEAANDAKDGGALLPTLLLGLPGSAVMAVLLGLFLVHGITPGPQVLREDIHLVATLINAHVIGNILVAVFALFLAPQVAKITRIRVTLVAPIILVFSLLGSFAVNSLIEDVFISLVFGLIGYAFKKYGFSRVAVVIALVLGQILEMSYHLTLSTMGYLGFFTRPLSLGMFIIIIGMLVWVAINNKNHKKGSAIHADS